ncbi:Mov34/MPN/PAD-1 family protein [Zavarzinia compransoris]|uniref:MPN domain-containing protein n=1 Tax=Zavarzinia compransoris TaxID=1264899 RepID=A0A317E9A8_9PROT|nr:M67 family metallopeptidase [Zavarzinia compransoris]PWR21695.1 hypothetical protein DKG75_06770 [Zavarzinia compransoris]TDP45519.1 proteasome lid subunit RPN8/RPN11 [Zavarzinia compransoris]
MTAGPPIRLTRAVLGAVCAHARAALPAECCGLLLGPAGAPVLADEAVASANLAPAGGLDAFEIDTALHLALQRRARDAGRRILGLYHSHPGGLPIPSARDRAGAWDHGLVWLIVGDGGIVRAWRPGVHGFTEAAVEVDP